MNINSYKQTLLNNGRNLAQVRRNQSDMIINSTFTGDPAYKRVKILTPDGWKWEDAKYQKHTTPSILKDEVDYYLQFRPGVHYKLGTYVIIPDDTSPDVNTPEDPFDQDYADRTQWWLIVGRTDTNAYVRFSVLKCNWDFTWIYQGEIRHCFGCVRNSNSYTSGEYLNDRTLTLDNVASGWLPDVRWTYGDSYKNFGLDDIQSICHGVRFMISDNMIYPKTYQVSKVTELVPAGIVKLTMKQKPFDEKRDNTQLRICDYYDVNGEALVNVEETISENDDEIKYEIITMVMNSKNELVEPEVSLGNHIKLRKPSYFKVKTSSENLANISYIWKIEMVDEGKFSETRKHQLEQYMGLTDFENGSIVIKPNRIKDLLDTKFILSVYNEDNIHYSSITLEVGE